MKDLIDVIAIIASPVVALLVGRFFQKKDEIRKDKMEIFRTLMIGRGMGWSIEKIKAFNIIEVVFGEDKKVVNQWRNYHDRLCVENPTETELLKIKTEGDKLLDVMAKSLGYAENVTWETIQNPYIPKGLMENLSQQQQYQSAQIEVVNMMCDHLRQGNPR